MPDFDYLQLPTDTLNEMCSRTFYTIDGLWFRAVEDEFGFETAFALNQVVWKSGSYIHGKRLLKNLEVDPENPLKTLSDMLLADPLIYVHRPEITVLTNREAVLSCPECSIQVARIAAGKGVYDGAPGCTLLYTTYAGLIDPRITVTCLGCGRNPDNPEYWCEWRFELPQGSEDEHREDSD